MIIAQIGVGQHIIADFLRIAQAPAVADHQPGLGPQHRQMIANRLGVRWPDPDVDQRDPRTVGADKMIGRHLVAAPCRVGQQHPRVRNRLVQIEPASARQCGIAVLAQLLPRPANEFIDIAVIVGEQDVALKMLDPGAGIMGEAREAEIGPQSVEQRQRDGFIRPAQTDPVGQFVADRGKFGRGEVPGQILRAERAEAGIGVDHIGEGDFLSGSDYLDIDVVIVRKERQLIGQVIRKQRRAGYCGGIGAGMGKPPKSAGQVGSGLAAGVMDPELGIAPGARNAAICGGEGAVCGKGSDV